MTDKPSSEIERTDTAVRSRALQIARQLGTWQRLDIALIDRQGSMAVTSKRPRGRTGELIDLGVVRWAKSHDEYGRPSWALIPGRTFGAVRQAITDLGKAAPPA